MSSLTVIATNRGFGMLERESQFRHRKRFPLTMRFRKEKVRVIRQQLAEGIYDLNKILLLTVFLQSSLVLRWFLQATAQYSIPSFLRRA
jgi:hypothetical protein